MPYFFNDELRFAIQHAFESATMESEAFECSHPDTIAYFFIRFGRPVIADFNEAEEHRFIDRLFMGDQDLSRQCNLVLNTLGLSVVLGFRWCGLFQDKKAIQLEGIALKINGTHAQRVEHMISLAVITEVYAKAQLIKNSSDFLRRLLVHRLVNTCCYCRPRAGGDLSLMWHFDHAEHGSPPARGRHDKGSYLQEDILAPPVLSMTKSSVFYPCSSVTQKNMPETNVEALIRQWVPTISSAYHRADDVGINPAYQALSQVSCSLALNEKKIWLLRSDFILAVGNKNAYWVNFKENALSQCIEPALHSYINWDNRYGHSSLAIPDETYDGSAYYGGYFAQRHAHLEVYLFSGRYQRNDLSAPAKTLLETYIAHQLQMAYGSQPVEFIDAVLPRRGERHLSCFDLSFFHHNKPLPDYCVRRIYAKTSPVLDDTHSPPQDFGTSL